MIGKESLPICEISVYIFFSPQAVLEIQLILHFLVSYDNTRLFFQLVKLNLVFFLGILAAPLHCSTS